MLGENMIVTKSFTKGANYQVSVMNEQKLIRKTVSDLSSEMEKYNLLRDGDLGMFSSCSKVEEEDEVMEAECSCCGLKEDCTKPYIEEVEKCFCGKWVCGLCSEAVKERRQKFPNTAIDEALTSHRDVCNKFNSTTRLNPKLSLTSLMRDIAKRSSEKRNSRLARSVSCDPRVGFEKFTRDSNA